jgi:DNA-3-methyladenine glycosylase
MSSLIVSTGLLERDFYLRPTLEVAHDLIGKYLVYKTEAGLLSARLVEVEAYIGEDDLACHASVGITKRNAVMYGMGGYSYIYFIYGMYYCLNVVTEDEGFPAAVLIRGAEPVEGMELMRHHFGDDKHNLLTNGPGKLCKAFALTRKENGIDLTGNRLYLEDRGYKVGKIGRSTRIGINKGIEKKWRFVELNSQYLSAKIK